MDLHDLLEQAQRMAARQQQQQQRRQPIITLDELLRRAGVIPQADDIPGGDDPPPNLPAGQAHVLDTYRLRLTQQEVAALSGVLRGDDHDLLEAVKDTLVAAGVRLGRAHPLEAARRASVCYLTWRRGNEAGDLMLPAMMLPALRAATERLEARPLGTVWNGPSHAQLHQLRWVLSPPGLEDRMKR